MFKVNKQSTSPRFVIFIADILVCILAVACAYLLRFDFGIPKGELKLLSLSLPIYIVVRALSFWIGKTFASYVRYTSIEDAKRIVLVILIGTTTLFGINLLNYLVGQGIYIFPRSVLLIDFFICSLFLLGGRILVKLTFYHNSSSSQQLTLIYGAGELGLTTKQAIENSAGTAKKVVGFVDDDKRKVGNRVGGIKVYHSKNLAEVLNQTGANEVIFAILKPRRNLQQRMVDLCLEHGVHMLHVPAVSSWVNGQLSLNQIKDLKIEDLLERREISLDRETQKQYLNDKEVLVTGAAGSIGSEICRQILELGCKKLWLLDQAETPLYEIEQELLSGGYKNFETIIADVCNYERMQYIMDKIRVQVIFHAAAYKHVPLMESNPCEAVKVNALASHHLGQMAVKYGVERFVFVSTDKAVNPTNVMGASKRLGEILLRSLKGNTVFIATRFGNVLGSNGSVIPHFKKQIERGGPVTITHPEITRYFMTIPEACSLVLEAGTMGTDRETYVFDMGDSVRIVDLAKNMIRLYGLTPDKDIKIIYTGLRPGEKLYEETLATGEHIKQTHHPKIHIYEDENLANQEFEHALGELDAYIKSNDNYRLVERVKQLVPEYKSNNSEFSKLD